MPKTSPAVQATPAAQAAINDVANLYCAIREHLRIADAILDAAKVLTALERAPVHHDAHPSHNILTGGGYAHGLRCCNDTLPALLEHARCLVQMADNDCDCMQEAAVNAPQEGGVQ